MTEGIAPGGAEVEVGADGEVLGASFLVACDRESGEDGIGLRCVSKPVVFHLDVVYDVVDSEEPGFHLAEGAPARDTTVFTSEDGIGFEAFELSAVDAYALHAVTRVDAIRSVGVSADLDG